LHPATVQKVNRKQEGWEDVPIRRSGLKEARNGFGMALKEKSGG